MRRVDPLHRMRRRHPHIHQHHIRLQPPRPLQHRPVVDRRPDHLNVLMLLQQPPRALTRDVRILRDQHANRQAVTRHDPIQADRRLARFLSDPPDALRQAVSGPSGGGPARVMADLSGGQRMCAWRARGSTGMRRLGRHARGGASVGAGRKAVIGLTGALAGGGLRARFEIVQASDVTEAGILRARGWSARDRIVSDFSLIAHVRDSGLPSDGLDGRNGDLYLERGEPILRATLAEFRRLRRLRRFSSAQGWHEGQAGERWHRSVRRRKPASAQLWPARSRIGG